MKELLFDAKCERCDSINEIDFVKRFGEIEDFEQADYFISKARDGFIAKCPICLMSTFHKPVTLIKNAE